MLRNRLVRQSAVSISSSTDSTASMPSPPPVRRRRGSQDAKMFRQMSSESLDQLLKPSPVSSRSAEESRSRGGRRHSVACGVLYVDAHRPSIKSAFNTACRRMSDACSLLSSAPSSTYNLSAPQPQKKENEVILPNVLRTYRPPPPKSQGSCSQRSNFQINRRFSTDCPPPTYTEATTGWKHCAPKQKLLTRQNDVVTSKASLVALEDDDIGIPEQN